MAATPQYVAVDSEHVYWTSQGKEAIGRMPIADFTKAVACKAIPTCEGARSDSPKFGAGPLRKHGTVPPVEPYLVLYKPRSIFAIFIPVAHYSHPATDVAVVENVVRRIIYVLIIQRAARPARHARCAERASPAVGAPCVRRLPSSLTRRIATVLSRA